jgi:hypothetical protein
VKFAIIDSSYIQLKQIAWIKTGKISLFTTHRMVNQCGYIPKGNYYLDEPKPISRTFFDTSKQNIGQHSSANILEIKELRDFSCKITSLPQTVHYESCFFMP